jgi:WD40 repeat protein
VAAGTADGTIRVWDLAGSGEPLSWTPAEAAPASVFEMAYSPDGGTIVSGANNGTVLVWDVASGQPRGPMRAAHVAAVTASAFSPDGQTFATGACGHGTDKAACDQGEILLWQLEGGEPVRLVGHGGVIYAVAFSPDGRLLASAGCGAVDVGGFCLHGEAILWDVATGQPLGEPLLAGTRELFAVAFSPNGRLLATGSVDSRVMLWNTATHEQVGQSLLGHPGEVTGLAFSPDGTILASSGFGALRGSQYDPGPVILWDVASGQPIGTPLLGHRQNVWAVDISPDGQWLVSGSGDRTVAVWDLRPAAWRQRACRVAHRNMTLAEWAQFLGAEAYRETCP